MTTLMFHKLNPSNSIPPDEDLYPVWGQTLKDAREEAVERRGRRKGYKYSYLPFPKGEEKLYTVQIVEWCPWKKQDVMGITFEREIFMPLSELGKNPKEAITVVALAANQLAALEARLKDKTVSHYNEATGETLSVTLDEVCSIRPFYGEADTHILPINSLRYQQVPAEKDEFPSEQPAPGDDKKGGGKKSKKKGGKK